MPIKLYILMLASVISAALITIWIANSLANSLDLAGTSMVAAIPAILIGLVLWRMLATRKK